MVWGFAMEKQQSFSGSLLNVNELGGVPMSVPLFGVSNTTSVEYSNVPSAGPVVQVEKPRAALDEPTHVVPITKGTLKLQELRDKLNILWKPLNKWGLVSLGRGFYEFVFSDAEDVQRVRAVLSWNLKPGFLKFFAWNRDFNSNNDKQITVQCWVCFLELPQEYWSHNIIFAIASCLGTPL
jgi:hypothetical protein